MAKTKTPKNEAHNKPKPKIPLYDPFQHAPSQITILHLHHSLENIS